SWLIHSITQTIANSVMWIQNAYEVWVNLSNRFSGKNTPRIFEIHRNIANLTQDTDSISMYYTKLKAFRDELSSYHTLPRCTCGVIPNLTSFLDEDYLMNFL
ncbi:UBN2_3 domain-containing protein, partial [Cephalotus follicularis]